MHHDPGVAGFGGVGYRICGSHWGAQVTVKGRRLTHGFSVHDVNILCIV